MAYQRTDRLAEEIQREVDDIIRHELNDPRIDGTYSITRVEVTFVSDQNIAYGVHIAQVLSEVTKGENHDEP